MSVRESGMTLIVALPDPKIDLVCNGQKQLKYAVKHIRKAQFYHCFSLRLAVMEIYM